MNCLFCWFLTFFFVLANKLPFPDAQRLVLNAGLSYVNESVSSSDDALEYAKICFTLFKTPSDEIRKEFDFVKALPILESYGVRELPTRLRLYVDKSRLIDEIFAKNPLVYKEIERIEVLSRYLRVDDDPAAFALIKCAENALISKDYIICAKFCDRIVDSNLVRGWSVCRQLALDDGENFNDKRSKCDLIQFCMAYCNGDDLEAILNAYVRCKNELMLDHFTKIGVSTTITGEENRLFDRKQRKKSVEDIKKLELFNDDVRLDPFYIHPSCFYAEKSEKLASDYGKIMDLVDFTCVLTSNRSKIDVQTLEKFYFAIARRSLAVNTNFAAAILLNSHDRRFIDNCMASFKSSSIIVELMAYLISLTFVYNSVDNVSKFLSLKPRDLISLTFFLCKNQNDVDEYLRILNEWKLRLDNFQQNFLLDQLPEGVFFRFILPVLLCLK